MVQVQPALAGSASVAALLAGIESYRTAVAAHPQERDAQSILRRPGRPTRHANADLWGKAVPPPTNPVLSDAFLLIVMSLYFYAVVLARFEEFALSFRRGIEHGLERTMSSQDTLRFR